MGQEYPLLVCFLGAIQVLGLGSAAAARVSEGSRRQRAYQWVFLGWLGMVGLSGVILAGLASTGWLISGTTLSLMVVTGTCQFGRTVRTTAW
jgi:hypothetical protein